MTGLQKEFAQLPLNLCHMRRNQLRVMRPTWLALSQDAKIEWMLQRNLGKDWRKFTSDPYCMAAILNFVSVSNSSLKSSSAHVWRGVTVGANDVPKAYRYLLAAEHYVTNQFKTESEAAYVLVTLKDPACLTFVNHTVAWQGHPWLGGFKQWV